MKKIVCILLAFGISVIVLSGCRKEQTSILDDRAETVTKEETREAESLADHTPGTKDTQEEQEKEEMPDTQETARETEEEPVIIQNLNADRTLFTETFYKAGDINYWVQTYVDREEGGDEFCSDVMQLYCSGNQPRFAERADENMLTLHAQTAIETVPGKNVYETELIVSADKNGVVLFETACAVTVTLPQKGDGNDAVSISQKESREELPEEAKAIFGEYYPMQEQQELFERYLCRAELCAYPSEDLRLMRNTIYAAHGRKFKDPVLTEYMEKKPWYRGNTEPESFSEEVFSNVEKENIRLLQEMENEPFEERNGAAYSIENFEPAPYLAWLSQKKETGLSVNMEQAEDCGVYYRVWGTLSLPVTFTRKQWEEVKNGGKAELCTNELTGERKILEYDREKGYRMYKKGAIPDDFPLDIRSYYNYSTGLYELYETSDDTIMKPVYEGDLFILKGAVCGGMVNLTAASALQEEITPNQQEMSGNCLYHNGRGYFTAIYYLGD